MIQILLNILKTENQTISLSDKCLLEPYVLKGTRGVLRRVWESNLPLLSDVRQLTASLLYLNQ